MNSALRRQPLVPRVDRAAPLQFPARQYAVNGERRSFALLRPIGDISAQERIRDLVLQAYAEHEQQTANEGPF